MRRWLWAAATAYFVVAALGSWRISRGDGLVVATLFPVGIALMCAIQAVRSGP